MTTQSEPLFINGTHAQTSTGRTIETVNPATGDVIASVQVAGAEEINAAITSAEKGQKIWAAMTAVERSRILNKAVAILRERNDELARLESLDTGKPFSETSTVDIVTGADVLEYYAGLAPAIEGIQAPCVRRASSTPDVSRSALSPQSGPGIIPSRSRSGNRRPRSLLAMRLFSSRAK